MGSRTVVILLNLLIHISPKREARWWKCASGGCDEGEGGCMLGNGLVRINTPRVLRCLRAGLLLRLLFLDRQPVTGDGADGDGD